MNVAFGPTDPEHNKLSAGVGAACREPHMLVMLEPRSENFKAAQKMGRLAAFALEFEEASVVFFVIYGWTGGHTDNAAAQRTDSLFEAIEEEASLLPQGPKCILGDVNADVDDLPTLEAMVDQGGWTDCGNQAHIWGGAPDQTACSHG